MLKILVIVKQQLLLHNDPATKPNSTALAIADGHVGCTNGDSSPHVKLQVFIIILVTISLRSHSTFEGLQLACHFQVSQHCLVG